LTFLNQEVSEYNIRQPGRWGEAAASDGICFPLRERPAWPSSLGKPGSFRPSIGRRCSVTTAPA